MIEPEDLPRSLLFVLTNALPGRDDEYNEWYDRRHLTDVCVAEGLTSAVRYELSGRFRMPKWMLDHEPDDVPMRYLTVYEIEGDVQKALDALEQERDSWDGIPGALSESYDRDNVLAWAYTQRPLVTRTDTVLGTVYRENATEGNER